MHGFSCAFSRSKPNDGLGSDFGTSAETLLTHSTYLTLVRSFMFLFKQSLNFPVPKCLNRLPNKVIKISLGTIQDIHLALTYRRLHRRVKVVPAFISILQV